MRFPSTPRHRLHILVLEQEPRRLHRILRPLLRLVHCNLSTPTPPSMVRSPVKVDLIHQSQGTKAQVITIQSGWHCSFQRMRRPAHAASISPIEVFVVEATPHDTNLLWCGGARSHDPSQSGFGGRQMSNYGPTDWRRPQTARRDRWLASLQCACAAWPHGAMLLPLVLPSDNDRRPQSPPNAR
jgi:hypothetical protein